MAWSLEKINEERVRQGKEPLTEIPTSLKEATPDNQQELEAKKKEEELAAVKKKEEEEKGKSTPENIPAELDDAKVLEYLKKYNPDIKSIEDLKPKVNIDPEKEAEEREAAKVSYGLQKGLFRKKDYDGFISDSKDPVNLVYDEYLQAAKKDDANLTDEEILEEFKDEYGLNADKGSRKYNRGQKDLALHSEKILQTKYSKILSLDSDFDRYENSAKEEKARQQKILTEAPVRKQQIETAFDKLKKINWEADKDEKYEIEYPEEVIASVKKGLLNPNFIQTVIDQEWSEEQLTDAIDTTLRKAGFAQILKKASDAYHLNHVKGSKGIPEGGQGGKKEITEPKLSDNQKIARDEMLAAKNKSMPELAAN